MIAYYIARADGTIEETGVIQEEHLGDVVRDVGDTLMVGVASSIYNYYLNGKLKTYTPAELSARFARVYGPGLVWDASTMSWNTPNLSRKPNGPA